MRYIKVLILVLFFFVSMLFLFQNQEILARDMPLKLDIFVLPPFQSPPLPTYFILLAGFLLGALSAVVLLVWDKFALSAKLMKAQWKIRDLEKELARHAPKASDTMLPLKKSVAEKADIGVPDPDGR